MSPPPSAAGRRTFCLTVPSGEWSSTALTSALHAHHPDADVVAVWCGDPHRRPLLDPEATVRWADLDLAEPTGSGWGLLLAALDDRAYEWSRTAAAVTRLLDEGGPDDIVVVLRVSSVAVLGDCASLTESTAPITVVPRTHGALPADNLAPTEADLLVHGGCSTSIAAFRSPSRPALAWLGNQLGASFGAVGPLFTRMAALFGGAVARDDIAVAGWDAVRADGVALLDLDQLDRDSPWHFAFGGRPARVRLSADPALAAAVAAGSDQLSGSPWTVVLPGGVSIEPAVRASVRDALTRWRAQTGELPPQPFGPAQSAFLAWLELPEPSGTDIGRYWFALRAARADLLTIFPQPQSADAARFREWIEHAWRLEPDRSALVRPSSATYRPVLDEGRDLHGVNLLGYFDFDQSQGHIAREIGDALEAAGVPVMRINHHRSLGSPRPRPTSSPREARYAANLVVVNPDQFDFVVADHGATLLPGRRTIGYWFWELEHIPDSFLPAIDRVDEIWAGSQFVADAFARVTRKPVRCVPLPVARPEPSTLGRAAMGLPQDAYVFLATFDQFSVPERKNPFGVIAAFCQAFDEGSGPVLLIKTMNGAKGWRNHERLLLAASGRSDIIVWDEHLSRSDQMAVLDAADCLVSLHRSEGLGLHCAEAMWLGKPVIATNYSGNVDFMDASVAAMVGYTLVPVAHGEGIYPETASWAEPDIGEAAAWMRRLAADPSLGIELGRNARERMRRQTSIAETGRRMAALAGVVIPTKSRFKHMVAP